MNWDWLKEIAQKAITVGVIAVGAALAEGAPIEQKAMAMLFCYAVWAKVIVPHVNGWLNEGMRTEVGPRKSGWDLI